jgi:hypothetical protein
MMLLRLRCEHCGVEFEAPECPTKCPGTKGRGGGCGHKVLFRGIHAAARPECPQRSVSLEGICRWLTVIGSWEVES